MTRLANVDGRATLILGDRLVDVERRSDGRFPADPMAVIERWAELRDWAPAIDIGDTDADLAGASIGPSSPRPQQVFGVGLNYHGHAAEMGFKIPRYPMVFTKFSSCLAGPDVDVPLPSAFVDYEAELLVVIGRGGRGISEAAALDHVAGYCVSQDYSERRVQMTGSPAQYSLGKSYPAFGPFGPIVSLDELPDPLDLRLTCDISGVRRQDARTTDLIFSVPELVAYLSTICELRPGDVLFTGTPAGVAVAHDPPPYLEVGDTVVTTLEGVGTMTNRCVGA